MENTFIIMVCVEYLFSARFVFQDEILHLNVTKCHNVGNPQGGSVRRLILLPTNGKLNY